MRLKQILIVLAVVLVISMVLYQIISVTGSDKVTALDNQAVLEIAISPSLPEHKILSPPTFVGVQVCSECHTREHKLWSGSHHDWAMREATEETVLGDFDDSSFDLHGEHWNFQRQDDQFIVNTVGPDGEIRDFKVKYTFGVDPLQQYLVEFPRGRLQALTVAWDTRAANEGGQKWFHLSPEEEIKADDPLHWSGRSYNWNSRCAECHSTNLNKNYDLSSDSYETSWSEINVSCEACHGPGSTHIEWTELGDDERKKPGSNSGLIVNYRENDASYQIDTCARCHSRRHPVSVKDGHGKVFLDDFMPATLQSDLYHLDGQILDEVYVYGSFLQSKMHSQGVTCTDCHDPHSNGLKLDGNKLCLQCHQPSPPVQRFPTLKAKEYDVPEHHFHTPGSEGAQCVNCHMPATTYMVIDPRRDHSFKIPRPELSEKLDTPNVCNSCHRDKSSRWAVQAIEKIHGARAEVNNAAATIFAAASQGDASSIASLAGLVNDAQTPAIVSATALTYLPRFFPDPRAFGIVVESLKNKDALIRATAVSALDAVPLEYRLSLVSPLLDDPVRAVRIEAARMVAALPAPAFAEQQKAFETALEEYRALQSSLADTPEAHTNLAVMYTDQKWLERAEEEYHQAIRIAPEFIPARINLANLYNKIGRNNDAEKQLRLALQIAPDQGELYYSLGLLLAEEQRLEEVADLLEKAAQLMPDRARVAYNYALTLQQLNQVEKAELAYNRALSLAPQDADVIYALVTLYSQQQQWQKALPFATKLADLLNGESGSRKLLEDIRKNIEIDEAINRNAK